MNPAVRWLTGPAVELMAMANDTAAVLRRELRYRDVPAVAPNVGLIGEAFLDGGFSFFLNLMVGVPDAARVRRGHHELLALRDFLERRDFVGRPASYHRTPPPLRDPERVSGRLLGWRGPLAYERIAFESGYTPHPGEPGGTRWLADKANRTAHAHVLRHEEVDRPWIVALHGFGMGHAAMDTSLLSARWLHEVLGLNVLLPVLPLHGPRSSTRVSGAGLLRPELSTMLHVFAQGVWDLRRLVGWLRGTSSAPIGLYGISLGAYVAALASAFVDDLACVVAGIPAVDFTSLARSNEPPAYQAFGADLQTDWGLVQEVMHPVSPLTFAPRVERSGRYIYAGVADRVARPDQARALWRHWDRPEIAWMSSGHLLAAVKGEVRPFLERVARRHLLDPTGLAAQPEAESGAATDAEGGSRARVGRRERRAPLVPTVGGP